MKKPVVTIFIGIALLIAGIKFVAPIGDFARDHFPAGVLKLIGESPSITGRFNRLKRKTSNLLN